MRTRGRELDNGINSHFLEKLERMAELVAKETILLYFVSFLPYPTAVPYSLRTLATMDRQSCLRPHLQQFHRSCSSSISF